MLKKAHIQQKLSCDILKNMLDMDVMFFLEEVGVKIHPMSLLWSDYHIPHPSNPRNPSPLVSTILVDQNFGECNLEASSLPSKYHVLL